MKYSEKEYPLQKESYQIIGICMEVHRILGKGLLEIVYKDAIEYEIQNNKTLIIIVKNDHRVFVHTLINNLTFYYFSSSGNVGRYPFKTGEVVSVDMNHGGELPIQPLFPLQICC